ncbi:NAD-dependent epimerase/dehydratase family protein, partial [bacterium]|nr:NAD-dependent epimerase/dehydratase family protein [bacterium]
PCITYTPPSLGIIAEITSPPRDANAYAEFLEFFLDTHGNHFEYIELWNEPNNRSCYDYILDESWDIFSSMIIGASGIVKKHGKKSVLGGISPINPGWIKIMGDKKVLDHIDVVGIHGYPDVYDSRWRSWEESIDSIQNALDLYGSKAEIWITETGYSTWRYDERKQVEKFISVLDTLIKRVYWLSLLDTPSKVSTRNGHHIDERDYHFGMLSEDYRPKLLYQLWSSGGIDNVRRNKWMASFRFNGSGRKELPVLITGGAGFIGTNLANRLLDLGHSVYIFDNLSRPGVDNNLKWLKQKHKNNLRIIIADIRDRFLVEESVKHVSHVFHLAAQVAVTTSLIDPYYDYSVNARGTLN